MPILALHGFTGCGSDFAPFAEVCGPLSAGDWHCPNLPGHGPNPQIDCTPVATTASIRQFYEARFSSSDPTPKILLGYSMGARVALLLTVQFPDFWDALILISGNAGIEAPTERKARVTADADLAAALRRMGVPAFLEFWQETPLIRSQKNIAEGWRKTMLKNRASHTARGLAASLEQFGQGGCPNLWPELEKLKQPVCLISGAKDTKYTTIAQRMRSRLKHPESRHDTIEGASHMPHLERAEDTAQAITDFLTTTSLPRK